MIGNACVSLVKYYDTKTNHLAFKKRPILIIGIADSSDYVALPISKVSKQENIDPVYDYPLEIASFPLLNLQFKSYVRTHKQFIINNGEIHKVLCDFKDQYEGSYLDIVALVEQFQKDVICKAL